MKVEYYLGLYPKVKVTHYLDSNSAFSWTFEHFHRTNSLVVVEYEALSKEEKQRKFRSIAHWERIDERNNTISYPLPPSPEVSKAAIDEFVKHLKVEWEQEQTG